MPTIKKKIWQGNKPFMDTCVNNNKEKEFYTAIQEMIGELVRGNRFSMEVLHRMKAAYQALTEEKQ